MSRFGLRSRLIGGFVGVSVIAAALVAATTVVLMRDALVDRATSQAVERTHADLVVAGRMVQASATPVHDPQGRRWRILGQEQLRALVDEIGTDVDLLIVQHGGPHYTSAPHLSIDDVPVELHWRVRDGLLAHMRPGTDRPQLIVGGRVALDALELYRFVDLAPVERDVTLIARTAAIAGAVPVVLALLVGTIAATHVLRPIRRARNAARSMAAGLLDTRVPVSGGDELAELAGEFNRMADSLQTTIEELHTLTARQRQFVADVAHELRTPLTALTAAVDVLEEDAQAGTADHRAASRLIVEEVRGLRSMVEDLMEISRIDAGAYRLDVHEVGLASVIEGSLRRRGFLGTVEVAVPPTIRVRVDPRRLDAIVGNLVANALVHGAPPVRVDASVGDDGVRIDVHDAGPGMPESVRERMFERFVKGDEARTRTGGSGLGLAIALENARLLGGDLDLVATGREGTTFRCRLPRSCVVTAERSEVRA